MKRNDGNLRHFFVEGELQSGGSWPSHPSSLNGTTSQVNTSNLEVNTSNLEVPDWRRDMRGDPPNASMRPMMSLVPLCRRLELCAGGRCENRWLHFERKRPRVSDLTCSQGIVFAVPASSSLTLRSSSVAHAAAHWGSSGPSTLSRISVASASRSSAGSCSARCRSPDALACAMGQF
jgi:hypothetical protein